MDIHLGMENILAASANVSQMQNFILISEKRRWQTKPEQIQSLFYKVSGRVKTTDQGHSHGP